MVILISEHSGDPPDVAFLMAVQKFLTNGLIFLVLQLSSMDSKRVEYQARPQVLVCVLVIC